jgi:hypothetical protein
VQFFLLIHPPGTIRLNSNIENYIISERTRTAENYHRTRIGLMGLLMKSWNSGEIGEVHTTYCFFS